MPVTLEQKGTTRVLFAGGGTGGHVYMAVAIRQELERRNSCCYCLFIGTDEGLESKILPSLKFPLRTIRVGGLNRVGVLQRVWTLLQLPGSLIASLGVLREFQPSVIVGLGGYSSGPAVAAARANSCPILLIEPNVYPGLTNRLLARFADKIAVAFEETKRFFGSRAVVTGVPVRREFHEVQSWRRKDQVFRVLVFGGSQGSRPINQLLSKSLPHLPKELHITHQTGANDFEWISKSYRIAGIQAQVFEYLENMPGALGKSDLVISRAGASTVAELAAAGRPSILIPLPEAADNHQIKNARLLEKKGAAILREQSDLNGAVLGGILTELGNDRQRLSEMARAAKSLGTPDSVRHITDLIEKLAQ